MGTGPTLLLIHGAGGATHSFRHLIPLLSPTHRLSVVDLPGHGFTVLGARSRCSVDAMAQDLAALCSQENWQPTAIIGHSAGAALGLRMAEIMPLQAVIGINAALGKFEGVLGWVFPIMARLLALTPLVAQLFSKLAGTPSRVRQLLTSTGSQIDATGQAQYLHLLRMPTHISATLTMMAQWDLDGLLARLPRQDLPCLLITSTNDRAVPAFVSEKVAEGMPNAKWVDLPNHGYLVHEEAADQVAPLILDYLTRHEQA